MRHLWSLLAGVVAAPLTWVLVAAGQRGSDQTLSSWMRTDSFSWANLIEPAVYLVVAGVLLGLIGTLRVSPAGPLAAGLLLVIPYAGLFVDPFAVHDALPTNLTIVDDELPLHLPLDNGTLLLIGVLLLLATFSAQRWRRWPAPEPTPAATPPSGVSAEKATDDRTLDDWPPQLDSDASASKPASPASESLPLRRRETGSPWATPPQSARSGSRSTV